MTTQQPKKWQLLTKRGFWIWMGYQAVKGTITTLLIWLPIWYAYFRDTP